MLSVLVSTGVSFLLGPLIWHSRKYMCVYKPMYIHLSIHISLCNHVYHIKLIMSSYGCLLPCLIHYHLSYIILAFSPCLSVNSVQRWEESWLPPFAIHLLNCSIPLYMYSGIEIVSLCSLYREWKTLDQLECSSFCF